MIQLNYRDPRPIYEQVKDGIRKLAYSGVLGPDDKLPSVRELAMKLAINPNTIQRAYRELENEGYIYTLVGKGTFVAENDNIDNTREKELLQAFEELVTELLYLKVPKEKLKERIDTVTEGSENV